MNIRQESTNDYNNIYKFVEKAFKTAKVSAGNEQDYVNQLRAGGNYIPELALVMEDDAGKLIGHIMLTKIQVTNTDRAFEGLLLAPISIAEECRNQGLGGKLIEAAFVKAKALNYTAVFLVGDPAYYTRFGFRASIDFGIKNKNEFPDQYVLACELVDGALKHVTGQIYFEE